jgi:hypothetical protein
MNWNEAFNLINNNIQIGTDLNNESEFRIVVSGPNYNCFRYNYNGSNGYKIQIGRTNFIDIPFSMLEVLFNSAVENRRIYNRRVFRNNYERQLNSSGCHVHVVGKIFELSEVAVKIGNDFLIQ